MIWLIENRLLPSSLCQRPGQVDVNGTLNPEYTVGPSTHAL